MTAMNYCDCVFPIKSVVADEYISRLPKSSGYYTVIRHSDCIIHGVQNVVLDVLAPPPGEYDLVLLIQPARRRKTRAR